MLNNRSTSIYYLSVIDNFKNVSFLNKKFNFLLDLIDANIKKKEKETNCKLFSF